MNMFYNNNNNKYDNYNITFIGKIKKEINYP